VYKRNYSRRVHDYVRLIVRKSVYRRPVGFPINTSVPTAEGGCTISATLGRQYSDTDIHTRSTHILLLIYPSLYFLHMEIFCLSDEQSFIYVAQFGYYIIDRGFMRHREFS